MTSHRRIFLLRAVNVAGTRLPMQAVREMCTDSGFMNVRTVLASGNVIADVASPEKARSALERSLEAHCGKPIGVLVRTADDMARALSRNPFAGAEPEKTVAIFLPEALSGEALQVRRQTTEVVEADSDVIYVHYPDGQGRSRLEIKAAAKGTARNINTVRKLAEMGKGD